jgi:hypothetical protein
MVSNKAAGHALALLLAAVVLPCVDAAPRHRGSVLAAFLLALTMPHCVDASQRYGNHVGGSMLLTSSNSTLSEYHAGGLLSPGGGAGVEQTTTRQQQPGFETGLLSNDNLPDGLSWQSLFNLESPFFWCAVGIIFIVFCYLPSLLCWTFRSPQSSAATLKPQRSNSHRVKPQLQPESFLHSRRPSVECTPSDLAQAFSTSDRAKVATVVAVYNEEGHTLERTLKSLSAVDNDVMVVIDGITCMHPSMMAYLLAQFGNDIPVEEADWPSDTSETFVLNQRMPHGRLLSLVLKRHNCKKVRARHSNAFQVDGFLMCFSSPLCSLSPRWETTRLTHTSCSLGSSAQHRSARTPSPRTLAPSLRPGPCRSWLTTWTSIHNALHARVASA